MVDESSVLVSATRGILASLGQGPLWESSRGRALLSRETSPADMKKYSSFLIRLKSPNCKYKLYIVDKVLWALVCGEGIFTELRCSLTVNSKGLNVTWMINWDVDIT